MEDGGPGLCWLTVRTGDQLCHGPSSHHYSRKLGDSCHSQTMATTGTPCGSGTRDQDTGFVVNLDEGAPCPCGPHMAPEVWVVPVGVAPGEEQLWDRCLPLPAAEGQECAPWTSRDLGQGGLCPLVSGGLNAQRKGRQWHWSVSAARALGLAAQEGEGLSLGGCTLGPAQPTWNGGRSGICWLPSASLH